jgi:hypothetical protein
MANMNFNIDPWYDDYSKTKGFHRILFNPTFAVQARELTQMQTMLQNQIEQFGSHIFKHGSMVVPGNSDAEIGIPCIKIQPTYSSTSIDFYLFNEKIIIGQTSGVRAYVKKAIAATSTDPITFYLSYLSGGTNSELTFLDGEVLKVENAPSIACTTLATNANSNGTVAFIKSGVYYVNGFFVYCHPQIEVVSKYDATPSAHVLLKIVEETIDESVDESLLDPAQGSDNFAAPGANRYKISLMLTTLPLGSAITDNYVEIMRFKDGVMVEHVRAPKYNELEKSLAQRTYDEAGNYIVDGLGISVREHLKTGLNGGVNPAGSKDKIVYEVTPGKCYFKGFPLEKIATSRIDANKTRDASHVKQKSAAIKPSFGQYFYLSNITGNLDISNRETIQFWSISTSTGGSQIGSATALALDYHVGDGVNPVYKVFVSNVAMSSGTFEDIGSVRTASGAFFGKVVAEYDAPINSGSFAVNDVISYNSSTRLAMVAFYSTITGKMYAHRHSTASAPKVGDYVVGPSASVTLKSKVMTVSHGAASCIFSLPNSATKALKNSANAFDIEYTKHIKLTIAAGSTTTSTVPGSIVPIETGTFIALSSAGTDSISNYSLNGTGTAIVRSSAAPAGGITIYAQATITGGTPRTKSVTSYVASKSSAKTVLLDHADVFEVTSVIANGVETFNNWTLDNGATDYEYGVSKISLKNGVSLPSGTLTISYKYFSHTVGDFFSVDSYAGIANEDIPFYRSKSNGAYYELRDVLDFRKTYSMPSGLVVSDSIIHTSIQKYMGRIDSLCINKDAEITIISGTPAETPRKPTVPDDLYEVSRFYLPPYVYSIDKIIESKIATQRFTMKDIALVEKRLSNLETFSTMSAAENRIVNTQIVDPTTGIEAYKTGYIVESGEDPFGMASIALPEFAATMQPYRIMPRQEPDLVNLELWSGVSNSYTITNGMLSMKYTETPLASVGVSSRTTNLNPYMVVAWHGRLSLIPSKDYWVDTIDNPEVINNLNVTQSVFVPNQTSSVFVTGLGGFAGVATFGPAPRPPFVIGPSPAPAPAPVTYVMTAAPAPAPPVSIVPPAIEAVVVDPVDASPVTTYSNYDQTSFWTSTGNAIYDPNAVIQINQTGDGAGGEWVAAPWAGQDIGTWFQGANNDGGGE